MIVKSIAFDFFGVLTAEPYLISKVLYPFVSEFVSVDEVCARYAVARTNKISEEQFWKGIPDWMHKKEKFLNAVEPRDCVSALQNLSPRFVLGIISNTCFDWNAILMKRFALDKLFKVILLSNETGIAKPSAEVFKLFLERSAFAASECLFVDDQPSNLAAASAAEMKTVLFETSAWPEQENLFVPDAQIKSLSELEALLDA